MRPHAAVTLTARRSTRGSASLDSPAVCRLICDAASCCSYFDRSSFYSWLCSSGLSCCLSLFSSSSSSSPSRAHCRGEPHQLYRTTQCVVYHPPSDDDLSSSYTIPVILAQLLPELDNVPLILSWPLRLDLSYFNHLASLQTSLHKTGNT